LNTVEQATDTEVVTYIPRRLIIVREFVGEIEVIRAAASAVFRGKTQHPTFKDLVNILEGRCYSVQGYNVTEDPQFWFGRRYDWVIVLHPTCPDQDEHFCKDNPVVLEHALGME